MVIQLRDRAGKILVVLFSARVDLDILNVEVFDLLPGEPLLLRQGT